MPPGETLQNHELCVTRWMQKYFIHTDYTDHTGHTDRECSSGHTDCKVHVDTQISKVHLVTPLAKAHPVVCIKDMFSIDLVKIWS